jgi:hypothetical protein
LPSETLISNINAKNPPVKTESEILGMYNWKQRAEYAELEAKRLLVSKRFSFLKEGE